MILSISLNCEVRGARWERCEVRGARWDRCEVRGVYLEGGETQVVEVSSFRSRRPRPRIAKRERALLCAPMPTYAPNGPVWERGTIAPITWLQQTVATLGRPAALDLPTGALDRERVSTSKE